MADIGLSVGTHLPKGTWRLFIGTTIVAMLAISARPGCCKPFRQRRTLDYGIGQSVMVEFDRRTKATAPPILKMELVDLDPAARKSGSLLDVKGRAGTFHPLSPTEMFNDTTEPVQPPSPRTSTADFMERVHDRTVGTPRIVSGTPAASNHSRLPATWNASKMKRRRKKWRSLKELLQAQATCRLVETTRPVILPAGCRPSSTYGRRTLEVPVKTCRGACESWTHPLTVAHHRDAQSLPATGLFRPTCKCCQPTRTVHRLVNKIRLVCSGKQRTVPLNIREPVGCACKPCS